MIAGIDMQDWIDNGDAAMGEDEKGPPKYRPVDLTRLLEFYTLSVTGPNLPCLTQEDLAVQAWIRNKKGLLPSFLAKDLVFDEIHDPWLRQFMVLLIKDHTNPEQLRSNYLVKFYVERSVLRADDEYLHCIERPNDGLIGLHLSEELPNAFRTGFHHYTCGSRRLRYILDGIRFHLPRMSTRKQKCLNGTHVQISIVETEERVTSYIPPNHSIGILDDCVDSVLKTIFLKTGSLPESLCRSQTVRKRDVCFLLPGQSPPRRRGSKARRRRQERRLRMSSSAAQSVQYTNGIPKYDDKNSIPQDITSQQAESAFKECHSQAMKSQQEGGPSKECLSQVIKFQQEGGASKECQSQAITSQQQEAASEDCQFQAITSQQQEAASEDCQSQTITSPQEKGASSESQFKIITSQQEETTFKMFQSVTIKSHQHDDASKESQSEIQQSQPKEAESKDSQPAQSDARAPPRKNVKKMAVSFDLPAEPRPQRIKPETSQPTQPEATGNELTYSEVKENKPTHCKRKQSKRVQFQLVGKEIPETAGEVWETSNSPTREVPETSNSLTGEVPETSNSSTQKPTDSNAERLSPGKRLRAFLASLFSCVPRSPRPQKKPTSTKETHVHKGSRRPRKDTGSSKRGWFHTRGPGRPTKGMSNSFER